MMKRLLFSLVDGSNRLGIDMEMGGCLRGL